MKTRVLLFAVCCSVSLGLFAQTTSLPGEASPWIIEDFEGDSLAAANWGMADGGVKEVVADPFDPTNKVLRFVRKDGGAIWGGIIRNFNIDDPQATNLLPGKFQVGTTGLPKYQYLVFRALKSTPGEIVGKVEFKGLTPVQQYGSEHLPNDPPARVGKWQWFIFDLTNKAKSRSGYDLGLNNDKNGGYNILFIQPDRGGNKADTTYIDDVYFTNTPPVIPIEEQKISGFSALATDFKVVLKWNKMEMADKYHIKLNGQVLATIDDNRIVSKELTYDEAGMEPGVKYAFEIEGENNAGKKTDGTSIAHAYRLKAAEDFSWVLTEDFEKDFYKWTRWQDGALQDYFENPVKGEGNFSDRVLRLTRTPGDSLAYAAKGRSGNSNTFVTFTIKNYFEIPCDSTPTNEEAFKYFQMQMYSPTENGLPVVKIGGLTLDPIIESRKPTWVRDSLFQEPSSGTNPVKSYYFKNARYANEWRTYVYKFTKGLTNVSQIEILPDNTFENTKATQETRHFYVDNLLFSMSAEPVVLSALPKVPKTNQHKIFVLEDKVYFELQGNKLVSLKLFDVSGRMIADFSGKNFTNGLNSITIPQINNGVYIVELRTTEGRQSHKFVR
jgi:hypothetical protein